MNAPTHPFLTKARESLAGAESEFVNARDYQTDGVGQTRAARMLKSTRDFLDVISRK